MRTRYGVITVLLLAAIAFTVTLFRPQTTLAETPAPEHRTLSVSGRGTLTVKYDTAEITLGVTHLKDSATAAYEAMGASMDSVIHSLKAASVKDDEIKTGAFSLQAEYDWKDNTQTLRGFRATNTVTIKTQRLDKVAELVQVAVNAGSNQIQGIRFTVKDTDALLDQALDLAVDDAKAKAERVAGRLGTKVIGVMNIQVQDNGRGPIMYDSMAGQGASYKTAAPAAPVFSGTTEYTATVSVSFEVR